ncbi:MAG TPA: methyltransferase domain-containing protein [Terriglobales bacterium]|nr:methyltransferase domain-containing protein [Terriglobales bacterium]
MTSTNPALISELRRWWLAHRENSSALSTSWGLISLVREFLSGSLPSQRRQRYGDIDYDWERRVNTTSATISWRTRFLGLLNSPYQPIPPVEFHEIMTALSIDFAQFTFIDIGSGKGRALLLAAEYGFRRIIGVELLPELHQAAEENLRQMDGIPQKAAIELVCGDATEFTLPNEPSVIFLFNPLPLPALRKLVKGIEASLQTAPRSLYIAYANPVHLEAFSGVSLLKRTGKHVKLALFANA